MLEIPGKKGKCSQKRHPLGRGSRESSFSGSEVSLQGKRFSHTSWKWTGCNSLWSAQLQHRQSVSSEGKKTPKFCSRILHKAQVVTPKKFCWPLLKCSLDPPLRNPRQTRLALSKSGLLRFPLPFSFGNCRGEGGSDAGAPQLRSCVRLHPGMVWDCCEWLHLKRPENAKSQVQCRFALRGSALQ